MVPLLVLISISARPQGELGSSYHTMNFPPVQRNIPGPAWGRGLDCRKGGCGHLFEKGDALRSAPSGLWPVRRSLREKCFSRGACPREKRLEFFHRLRAKLRSRWQLCCLTDAAYPLRVNSARLFRQADPRPCMGPGIWGVTCSPGTRPSCSRWCRLRRCRRR